MQQQVDRIIAAQDLAPSPPVRSGPVPPPGRGINCYSGTAALDAMTATGNFHAYNAYGFNQADVACAALNARHGGFPGLRVPFT